MAIEFNVKSGNDEIIIEPFDNDSQLPIHIQHDGYDQYDIYYYMPLEQVKGLISFLKEQVDLIENKKI